VSKNVFYLNNNTMTDLDYIYRQKAVDILSIMKNIVTEYIENV